MIYEYCGDLPGDDVLSLRFSIFNCVEGIFFTQHVMCKITDKYEGFCCEEHKYAFGYPEAYENFCFLIKNPSFEFENWFSVFQLLFEFKIQVTISKPIISQYLTCQLIVSPKAQ